MAAYCQVDGFVTCKLIACTSLSALGPALGNDSSFFSHTIISVVDSHLHLPACRLVPEVQIDACFRLYVMMACA